MLILRDFKNNVIVSPYKIVATGENPLNDEPDCLN